MSLQTNVFENGRWVTRSLDPYHVRAQNVHREDESTPSTGITAAKVPCLGLLTRTLARSCVVEQIIPARIRHKSKNDVLFIGANCVTIKEAFGSYHLKDVAVKDDFGATIRSAKILGDPRETDRGDRYNSIRRGGETWSNYHDWPVETSEDSSFDEIDSHAMELSPHMAVLTLESNKIVFLCSSSRSAAEPKLLSGHHELPVARSSSEQLGAYIAVDPQSRAMAVAAHEGLMYIYSLKTMDVVSQEVHDGLVLNPIREERLIPVEGIISQMEFLHPPQNDPFQVILLLIVLQGSIHRAVWYEWNSNTSLREWQIQANRHSLRQGDSIPLLLIPLMKSAAFMVVWDDQIDVYRDILTGTPNRHVQYLDNEKEPEEPGISGKGPVWTQWARPMRSGGHRYTQVEDAIYLCREDGIIQYLEFNNGSDHTVDSTHQAGPLGVNVDKSFAVLDVGPNKLDLLVAGSGTSDGGLWRVETREDPKLLKTIPSWTPLNNFISVDLSDGSRRIDEEVTAADSGPQGQQKLLACTGKGKYGSIAELRYGLEASKIVRTADFDGLVNSGVLGIWAFHGFFGDIRYQFEGPESLKDVTYFILSHPTRTSLLRMRLDYNPKDPKLVVKDVGLDLETSTNFELIQKDIALDFSARTIHVGSTPNDLLVQITETSIIVSSVSVLKELPIQEEENDNDHMEIDDPGDCGSNIKHVFRLPNPDARFVAAHMHREEELSVLLVAVHEDHRFRLQLAHLNTGYSPKGKPWPLHSQPSCIRLQFVCNDLLAFVSTIDGQLQVFCVERQGLVSAAGNPYTFGGSYAICDSIAVLTSVEDQSQQSQNLIVCGLRNGSIHTLLCTKNGPSYILSFHEQLAVGNTSVTVLADVVRRKRAIIHCEQSLCALEYPLSHGFEAPAAVHNMWITDREQPALQQGSLSAITQVVEPWLHRKVSGLAFGALICMDVDLLHVLNLDNSPEPKIVPRCLPVGGRPIRVIYSAHLKRLIVLYEGMTITKPKIRNNAGVRLAHRLIRFLSLDGVNSEAALGDDIKEENHLDANDCLLLAERRRTEDFRGITEWFPEVDGKRFHLLVVNTELMKNGKATGRLLVFALTQTASGIISMSIKKKISLDAPVYSVAAYPGRNSLVYCCGSDLCIQTLSPHGWPPPVKATMRSPAQSVTISEPYIYVSSVRESLATFKYIDDQLVYQFGDQLARDGMHHILVPEHSLVLASDKMSSVVGLWQPPERRIDNAMLTVFEAILQGSVTNLRQVARPIWNADRDDPKQNQIIIGSSADGTLTQFNILSRSWRLLRFIQNMAERNKVVCPFLSKAPFKRHIEPSTTKPHYMHVNGDILQRVLERGGEELIKALLDIEPDIESHTDFDSAQARRERCKELASDVVDTANDDWLAKVVQHIRILLRSAL